MGMTTYGKYNNKAGAASGAQICTALNEQKGETLKQRNKY